METTYSLVEDIRDPRNPPKIDNHLCFAFYASSRALMRLYRELLDPVGITYPQYLVLIVLYESDGITLSQIGSRLMLDSGTLTPLLKRLEAMKVIERIRGIEDERTVNVWLTPKGLSLRQYLLDARINVGRKLGMSEAEITRMRELVMSIVDRLSKDEDEIHSGSC